MEIEDFSSEELQAELERRTLEGHNSRQSEIFRGEREDFTDGDEHIFSNGGTFRGERCGGRES